MAHQGRTSPQLGEKSLTVEKIGVEIGDSKNQVLRYIRLTHLIPELLDLMDEGKIALNPDECLSVYWTLDVPTCHTKMDSLVSTGYT